MKIYNDEWENSIREISKATDERLIEMYKISDYDTFDKIEISIELTKRGYGLRTKREWIKRV